jgi:hypothetical protein
MKFTPVIFIFAFFLSFLPALAADNPICSQSSMGTLTCMAGRQCECVFERGGAMTNKAQGYRWDCGLNRPNCPNPDANKPTPYDGPDSVSIDNSTVKVEQSK